MPHQCTSCDRTFADGSKQMLSGCPDCGGNTFQYLPEDEATPAGDRDPPDRPEGSGVAETVGRAATTLRDAVTPDPEDPTDRSFSASPREDDTPATPPSRADDAGAPAGAADAGEPAGTTDPAAGTADPAADETATGETPGGGAPRPETAPDTVEERRDAEFIDADAADAADGPEDSAQSSARSEVLDDGAFPGGVVGSDPTPNSSESAPERPAASPDGRTGTDRGSRPAVDPQPAPPDAGQDVADAGGATDGSAPAGPGGAPPATDADGRVVGTPEEDRPDLSDLREELNSQFEGIRVTEPGQYELNLMELYEREETIIALKEDGRYVIEVPEAWHGDD